MTLEPGQIEIAHSMTSAEIRECAAPVSAAMNAQLDAGVSVDRLLLSVSFPLGVTLARRGVVIDVNAPLISGLKPLADGYTAMRRTIAGGGH